jgi:hypothetical protein
MKNNGVLLRIRWWQIRKELQGIGILYAFVVLIFIALLSAWCFQQFTSPLSAILVTILLAAAVCSIHLGRKDLDFVYAHIEQPQRNIYVEYLVGTAPFAVPVLFTSNAYLFLLLQPGLWLAAGLRVRVKPRALLPFIIRYIPYREFEWRAGFRGGTVLILLLWLMALALCTFIVAPLVCLWFLTLIVASFYQQCESIQMLWAQEANASALLRGKIVRHGILLSLISVPPLVLNIIFQPQMIWINSGFLIAQWILLVFAITLKYATYRPCADLRGNSLLLGLAAVCMAIPFLLPVPVLMSIKNTRRALRNLNSYDYDQHSAVAF